MAQRRSQILDAFIRLLARQGLERTTLDDIAAEADIQRAALRHFVGNRQSLIGAAITELADRHVDRIRNGLRGTAGVDELIAMVFSASWREANSVDDRAFHALAGDAAHDATVAEQVHRAYETFVGEVQAVLRRDFPKAPASRIREIAYVLVCLAEQNKAMQQLGFADSLGRAATRAARSLVRDLQP
jgi:AcrR family transcriptional regulator